MKNIIVFILLVVLLTACPEVRYDTGHFQTSVQNFEDINSQFDDYNSTAPFIYLKTLFHFSSNRTSNGEDFDIVGENMFIDWSISNGSLAIGIDLQDEEFNYLRPMFDSINTSFNEIGPISIGFRQDISNTYYLWTDLIMYASDQGGNYNIRFIYKELHRKFYSDTSVIMSSHDIQFLNSESNDKYPCFFGEGHYYIDDWGNEPDRIQKIIYCSDRDGTYDIYEVAVPSDSTLINTLFSEEEYESRKLMINSESDDECPFVNGRLMVFSSNRPGGFGGYDLYYSEFINETWTAPINFGETINSEFDEFRPITLHHPEFDNNLLIFSSNRLGGKGGFDLYHVGIDHRIIE